MQEQNALIGVQMAAYFPDISLSAVLQWSGAGAFPFNVANEIWPLGGAATQILSDGGLRGAQIDAARGLLAKRRHLSENRAFGFPGSRG